MIRVPGNALAAALLGLLVCSGPAFGADPSHPLIDAVKSGSVDRVRTLLGQGVDVNTPQNDGATALHWAAHRNDLAAAELLLRARANVDAANQLGATAIWLASVNGSAPMIRALVDAGANTNVALESGETPLMAAARSGSVEAVRLLLEHHADVNASERLRGQTALMWAIDERHLDIVKSLIEHGADVHARSARWSQLENTAGNTNPSGDFEMEHGGSTSLLFAARQGNVDNARTLLDACARINDEAAAGTTALVVAAHSNHRELASFLLSRGADSNAAGAGYTALQAAVLRGNLELVKTLLAHGADPNARILHGTPLRRLGADYSLRHQMVGANAFWLAARLGFNDIMHVLAEHGATSSVIPKDGTTVLKAAMGLVRGRGLTENREGRYGAPLLEHGEEERRTLDAAKMAVAMGDDVNAVDSAGETALFDAARQRFDSVVQFLVDNGADLNVRNKRDQTPLRVLLTEIPEAPPGSEILNRQSTIDLLRKLGAVE
jgi:ankyrin repeat protein